jgi:hypothetical protein
MNTKNEASFHKKGTKTISKDGDMLVNPMHIHNSTTPSYLSSPVTGPCYAKFASQFGAKVRKRGFRVGFRP